MNNFLNFSGIESLLIVVAGLAVMFVGIGMASKSNKGNFKGQAEKGGSVFIAIAVIAAGAALPIVLGVADDAIRFLAGA